MKNLLIVLTFLASTIAFADAPVDLDLKKDQVVSVEINSNNYYVTMFRVKKDGDTLLVDFDGLAPGKYDAVIKVRESDLGKLVQLVETEIDIK